MDKMKNLNKLALAGILIAVGVVCSPISVPIGAAKCFPVQHIINVVASVLLGPTYAVTMAFITSFIRVVTGTGTLLAFPGSMVGALCGGLLYKYSSKLVFAVTGEIIGTGVLGAIAAYPIAVWLMGRNAAILGFVVPFLISTAVGSSAAVIIIQALKKAGVLKIKTRKEGEHVGS
nr:energy coupling factor transporter S component ThiW [Hydrogenoanaerobacterium saccharovorans]